MRTRAPLLLLSLSAAGLVGIATFEGYSGTANQPLPGDKPTYGFGSTTRADGQPVKIGDKITPDAALVRAYADVKVFEGALRECVKVPLHQHEYDAFVSFSYNVGSGAFCKSGLVKKLNAGDYAGACNELLRWRFYQGKDCAAPANRCGGLYARRQAERRQCLGDAP
ncbi:lysozyme [Azonexus sp.]|uniref:lysozyme n=1 Tax=Azonexus sp. TaxID=1872668 RepID=UPI0039E4E997